MYKRLRPVRAKVKVNRSPILLPLQGVDVYALIPRALSWALDWLPFQGARGEGCGARCPFQGQQCKGHRADIWRRPGAKHCSSLCSQSEGGEYCGGQALKIQQSQAPERWSCSLRVRGPHFASKVSYNAGAATDDDAGQRKFPMRGCCCQYLYSILNTLK